MTEDMFARTKMLIGDEGVQKLASAKVLVCGLGGVGGYVLEALARAGVGCIGVMDNDVFSVSNLNRQILATRDTIGEKKTEVAKQRVFDIRPDCDVRVYDTFYLPQNSADVDIESYDYIADAIDTVSAKIDIICRAKAAGIGIVSCMGTGNKLQTRFEVADIYDTSVCPLAKVMRKELKARGIKNLKVVYSKEPPVEVVCQSVESARLPDTENTKRVPASISYAPAIAGLMMAGEIINDLLNK